MRYALRRFIVVVMAICHIGPGPSSPATVEPGCLGIGAFRVWEGR